MEGFGHTIRNSTDGQNWNQSLVTDPDAGLSKVVAGGRNYVTAARVIPTPSPFLIYYTDDPTNTWKQVPLNVTPVINGSPDLAFGNSRFVAITGGKILRSNPIDGGFAPEIIKQPSSFAATIGGTATFTVAAQGSDPLSYHWRKGGLELNGQTQSTLTLTNVTFDSAGSYDVIVSNSSGSQTSTSVSLTINFARVRRFSGVTLDGAIGDKFLIEYQDELDQSGQWHAAATVTLANSTYTWIDYSSSEAEHRFYRATYQGK